MPQKLYLGADHAGWARKEKIKEWLAADGYEVIDLSNPELNSEDDYPEVAFRVAERVAAEVETKGLLLCGSGLGMCMAANKVKGIRAAAVYNEWAAKVSREDNNANVLCLPGRYLEDEEIKKITKVWLETKFSGEERHLRRINKLETRGGVVKV
ncbi:MAG: Sugar-phosphate isomerase, RpiB/LacA/LacB family [Candidatus Uhrbacteria bacterium GW2011_GWE2_45_35]|uniref:Sugar-phosphate isomerase, RpiB/LacA/LacB family n=2 Tax=Candidatus Uhriibacteriota TaxID=1752732 RepID=A0A0G1JJN4_9BACT|nr:MAG: Sugar-phosphate isomerase, RpiB/LacA/LacB family [Candidatus Uhrbacteria bacterium GW2011_GWF2_44_350]KKU08831.1 MAG: Sugar-phosphate isomerase, RpiB/LacA/LacB family [Candidatus Uhrbacteria bacterium GW2011_GWE2_45_35]HBR80858.1 ribose-5-phosphate isomerase [Candidatus Uhrbacteria bacterium]HCU32164.1 ribose-5-phosphate isomerase [Candidatus Uhrbacteria bacterium]